MKKKTLVVLICATLAMLMMLSSCATTGSVSLKSMLDGSQYEQAEKAYEKAEAISGLGTATLETSTNQLVLFADSVVVDSVPCKKYMVYNLDSNKIVYEATTSPTSNYDIDLFGLNDEACFTVIHYTWKLDKDKVKIGRDTIDTALYGADGVKVADTYREVNAEVAYDLIRFDGKCYRVGEEAGLEVAFEYSDLKEMPDVLYATEKLYFCGSKEGITVYNKELEVESYLDIPSYANVNAWVTLSDNKVLVQYSVEADPEAEKYDYIAEKKTQISMDDEGSTAVSTSELTKYDLYTVVFNAKNGKSDEIKFNYVINGALARTQMADEWTKAWGLGDKYDNLVVLAPIEDKRVNESDAATMLAALNSKGDIKEIKDVTDAPMVADGIYMVAANRWRIASVDGKEFIVNEKGKVIGETTSASYRQTYMYTQGKMYDYDLNVIYDYAKENLFVQKALDQAVLFRNIDEELICYTPSATTKLIEKDAKKELYLAENDYFIIKDFSGEDNVKFEIYNEAGKLITTISVASALSGIDVAAAFSVVLDNDDQMIMRVAVDTLTTGDFKYEYYRFS